MRTKLTLPTDEVLLATKYNSMAISRLVKKRALRKLGPRLYTINLTDPPEQIVKRNVSRIVGLLCPDAIISHRSSFETMPTQDGQFFATYMHSRKIRLPGLTINLLRGPVDTAGTNAFLWSLHISQRPRAFLENLQPTKRKSVASQKCLSLELVETKLDELCRVHGEEYLNRIRDEARGLSKKLMMEKEFEKLNSIIYALLATGESRVLKSEPGRARSMGASYDPARIERFRILHSFLLANEYKSIKRSYASQTEFETQAFFEAYFSNYIEGTRFPVDQAHSIVYEGRFPVNRPDAHDIIGTYKLVVNKTEISTLPRDGDHFLELLRHRHRTLMAAHPTILPGEFKEANNQAGSSLFVEPEAVRGTLIKGLEFYFLLQDPLKRALYIMFLIAEIHPFTDGNGRMARLMMNSQLFAHSLEKIIVPNVYREDYMGALKALSHNDDPAPYVRAMLKCLDFTSRTKFSDYETAVDELKKANAFSEPSEAKLILG